MTQLRVMKKLLDAGLSTRNSGEHEVSQRSVSGTNDRLVFVIIENFGPTEGWTGSLGIGYRSRGTYNHEGKEWLKVMAGRRSFKSDESFLEKISIGAICLAP